MMNLKKMLAALVASAMVASMAIAPAFAATYTYENEATALNTVGLYEGISKEKFDPDLGTKLDRQTGVTMLLRLFGQEDEALLLSEADANAKLAKFTDGGTVDGWAKKQVAYAVDKGFVKGIESNGSFSFQPKAALVGKAYASLILQQLGYNGAFNYNEALTALSNAGGLTAVQAVSFDKEFIKDDLVGLSYNALQAKYKADGKTVIKALLESGDVKKEDLDKAKIQYAYVKSVAPLADVTVDIGGTPKLPETVKATLDNDTTADVAVTWPTVDTSAAGEKTVTGTMANTTVTATIKVIVTPAELKVTGAVSGNRKELVLNFNRPVADADKAKNVANYNVKKYSVANADLSEDKMTVTLLIDQLITQQADVDVTVDKDLGFKEDVDLTIENVKDVTTPEVSSVEAVGNSLVKVTFSEPVLNNRSVSNYLIDGKSFAASKIEVSANGKVVNITLKTALTAEAHKLVVKDKVQDYAGFTIENNETEFTVVEDKEAPTGVIDSATQTKVVVKFSEPVKEPNEDDVDTSTSAKIEKRTLDDDYMTYTIEFELANPLPASGGKLTIDNLSDYSGNKTDFSILVEPKYDLEKPAYVSYKIDDNQKKIIVEFTEDIILDLDDYELVDADGDDVAISAEYDKNDKKEDVKKKVVIKRSNGEAFASEKHKLTIDGVKDITPIKNEMDKTTVTIDIEDQKAPTIEEVVRDTTWDDDADKYRNALYVRFNEDVDTDTATDYANYAFELAGKTTIFDLDKDFSDIELLSDERTVCITFDQYDDTKSGQKEGEDYVDVENIIRLQVDSVTDTAGNEMSRNAVLSGDFKTKSNALIPMIESAKVTGENTIAVKLNNKINDKTLAPDDFVVKTDDDTTDGKIYAIEVYDAEYKSDDDEIILNVNQDLAANATYKGGTIYLWIAASKDIDTVNSFDQKIELEGGSAKLVADSYNPTMDSVAKAVYDKRYGTYAEIEISEELALSEGAIADELAAQFSVKIGTDTVDATIMYEGPTAAEDVKATTDVNETKARFIVWISGDKANDELAGKTIKVTFTPLADSSANKANGLIILDPAGNALKEKSGMEKKISRVINN